MTDLNSRINDALRDAARSGTSVSSGGPDPANAAANAFIRQRTGRVVEVPSVAPVATPPVPPASPDGSEPDDDAAVAARVFWSATPTGSGLGPQGTAPPLTGRPATNDLLREAFGRSRASGGGVDIGELERALAAGEPRRHTTG